MASSRSLTKRAGSGSVSESRYVSRFHKSGTLVRTGFMTGLPFLKIYFLKNNYDIICMNFTNLSSIFLDSRHKLMVWTKVDFPVF